MNPPSLSHLVHLYDSTARYWDSRIHRGVYQRSYIQLFNRLEAQGWLGQHSRPLRVLDCGLVQSRLLGWMADAGIRSIWSGPLSGLTRPFASAYVGTKLE
jgi:hypothetical protein